MAWTQTRWGLLAAALALAAGCRSTPTPSAPAAPPATVAVAVPADDSLNATAWFQTSVERDLVFREVYRAAGERLPAALADAAWDALPAGERDNDPRALPPAIIVDVDETVLDNSPSQVRQIRERREYDETAFRAWAREGVARPLPGAVAFLRGAAEAGVTVFYVSNRDASLAAATVGNLRAAGFPVADAGQFLGLGTVVAGCEPHGSDKSCRRQSVGRRYRVLMQFGDQLGDFVALPANTRAGRAAAVAPYADWIGQRWWVLPNPVYGSWEPALFNNDWHLPAAVRRAAKEAALDDARH